MEQQTIPTRVEQIANLMTVGAGAANEMFLAELRQVLANIKDVNTEAKAKRKIKLEFVFVPTDDREAVAIGIAASSSMAKSKPASDVMYVGKHQGELIATVLHGPTGQPEDPRQATLSLHNAKKGA